MRRTVIEDCWGGRWTVRARLERHAPPESEAARRARERLLGTYLAPALAPQPGTGPAPVEGIGRRDDRFLLGLAEMAAVAGGVGDLIAAWRGVRVLRTPSDRFWVVELAARGRFRRGATWRVAGPTDAARVAQVVADAVRTGLVPSPDGAMLLDVVDERLTVYGALR